MAHWKQFFIPNTLTSQIVTLHHFFERTLWSEPYTLHMIGLHA